MVNRERWLLLARCNEFLLHVRYSKDLLGSYPAPSQRAREKPPIESIRRVCSLALFVALVV